MTLSLEQSKVFMFNPTTLENVRKEFNLDKPGAMDQAIDILHDWIQKQDHFVLKDFERSYLERFMISSKGSVEKSKKRIDKLCTIRTMLPELFEKTHAIKDFPNIHEYFLNAALPKLTEDDYRIQVWKIIGKIMPSSTKEMLQHYWIVCEYSRLHDYCKGYHCILDFTDSNLMQANVDWMLVRNGLTMLLEAYGFRIKSVSIISSSKLIHGLITVAKQFLSPKIAGKIRVLKTVEALHDFLPKNLLPEDYGGEQNSIKELFATSNEEYTSEKHLAHIEEMKQACTNEKLRSAESFDKDCLGMPAREYLERCIISAKGSLEKAKTRIERLYTMQTVTPKLFEKCHAIKDFPGLRDFFVNVLMPNISKDNCRVHVGKLMSHNITPAACFQGYQHTRIICEHAKLCDYVKGYHVVYDLSDVNIMEIITNVDWVDMRTVLTAIIEAYGFRLMNIYIVSNSTMINALLKIVKQLVSEKIASRIYAVKNAESLHELIPKKLLPRDYGGELKSILELYDEMNEELTTEELIGHIEEMRKAHTIEELRVSDSYSNEYLGMPGSFKMLSVD